MYGDVWSKSNALEHISWARGGSLYGCDLLSVHARGGEIVLRSRKSTNMMATCMRGRRSPDLGSIDVH